MAWYQQLWKRYYGDYYMDTSKCYKTSGNYAGRRFLDYNLKVNDKVLDIGGGPKPFVFATHILDSTDTAFDQQRYDLGVGRLPHQTLIDGTTDRLVEFEDNEFDFIYCCHVLEHVDNLPEAIDEISRVGKRGFISVPHYSYDAWSANLDSGHKWLCDYDFKRDVLLIRKRGITDYVDYAPEVWKDVMSSGRNPHWVDIWEGHRCAGLRMFWEIRFFWEDQIVYEVDETIAPQLKLYNEMMLIKE